MKSSRTQILTLCIALLLSVAGHAQHTRFVSKEHKLSVSIPNGWDQVQGVLETTVLKLARAGRIGQNARIVINAENVPPGRVAPNFDIWDMSNDDLRKAAKGNSVAGEKVTVVDVGRATVDGVHAIWNKAHRPIPDGTVLWEFVYEALHDSRHITIRLSTVGTAAWFDTNQAVFADFIRSLRLTTR